MAKKPVGSIARKTRRRRMRRRTRTRAGRLHCLMRGGGVGPGMMTKAGQSKVVGMRRRPCLGRGRRPARGEEPRPVGALAVHCVQLGRVSKSWRPGLVEVLRGERQEGRVESSGPPGHRAGVMRACHNTLVAVYRYFRLFVL
jgi:hypothetical protein